MNKTLLNECFRYVDGALFWKERPRRHFKSESACRIWNLKFSGKEAGSPFRKGRYKQVTLNNQKILAHRVVWIMHHGAISDGMVIDHIDGDGTNNKLGNLRLATNSINQRNSQLDSRNKSGIPGVNFDERLSKWKVQGYRAAGERVYLGVFDTLLDAAAIRKSFNLKHGYTQRHGCKG